MNAITLLANTVGELLLVDDRARSVKAAATIGIRSLRFNFGVGYGRLTAQLLGVRCNQALERTQEG